MGTFLLHYYTLKMSLSRKEMKKIFKCIVPTFNYFIYLLFFTYITDLKQLNINIESKIYNNTYYYNYRYNSTFSIKYNLFVHDVLI